MMTPHSTPAPGKISRAEAETLLLLHVIHSGAHSVAALARGLGWSPDMVPAVLDAAGTLAQLGLVGIDESDPADPAASDSARGVHLTAAGQTLLAARLAALNLV